MGSVRVPQLWVTEEIRSWKRGHAAACSWLYVLVIMVSVGEVDPQESEAKRLLSTRSCQHCYQAGCPWLCPPQDNQDNGVRTPQSECCAGEPRKDHGARQGIDDCVIDRSMGIKSHGSHECLVERQYGSWHDQRRGKRPLGTGKVHGRQSKDVYLVQRPASERRSLLPDGSSHPTEEEAELLCLMLAEQE